MNQTAKPMSDRNYSETQSMPEHLLSGFMPAHRANRKLPDIQDTQERGFK